MKVLIYKRTHKGDPDNQGIFGIQDCMGRIRDWNYDAVIGIGGHAPWRGHEDIRGKINWVGIEPKKIKDSKKRGSVIIFSHFELYEGNGLDIKYAYPALYNFMYKSRKRFDMSTKLDENVFKEVKTILDSIKNSLPSKANLDETIDLSEIEKSVSSSKCRGCLHGEEIEITVESCDL